jgi:hypothetical protein
LLRATLRLASPGVERIAEAIRRSDHAGGGENVGLDRVAGFSAHDPVLMCSPAAAETSRKVVLGNSAPTPAAALDDDREP